MLIYWIFVIGYLMFALMNIKKAILAWIPVHLLCNPAEVLWTFSPILTVQEAISLTLPIIFYIKGGFSKRAKSMNNEKFLFGAITTLYFWSYFFSSLFSNYNSLSTILYSIKFIVSNFLIVWMFQKALYDSTDFKFFVRCCIVITFIIVGLAVSEKIIGTNIWQDYVWATSRLPLETMLGRTWYVPPYLTVSGTQQMRFGLARCYSFFSLHLGFGSACVLLLFFFGILWKRHYKGCSPKLLSVTLILLIVGIFLSNSKGPMLCMIAIIFVIFKPKQIFDFKVVAAVSLGLIVLLIYFPDYLLNYVSLFDEKVAREGSGSTIDMRLRQWDVASNMFWNRPILGYGPQSLRVLMNTDVGRGILGAESVWLRILPERGLFGISVFLLWYILTFNKFKVTIPVWEITVILGGLLLIETTNGMRDMMLYAPLLIATRKLYIMRFSEMSKSRIDCI